jgi:hypothetical protein
VSAVENSSEEKMKISFDQCRGSNDDYIPVRNSTVVCLDQEEENTLGTYITNMDNSEAKDGGFPAGPRFKNQYSLIQTTEDDIKTMQSDSVNFKISM